MSAYRNYPEGYEPSAGPFDVFVGAEPPSVACQFIVQLTNDKRFVQMRDPAMDELYNMFPNEARELAAALIEVADHIDRANMTAEDIARETRSRA